MSLRLRQRSITCGSLRRRRLQEEHRLLSLASISDFHHVRDTEVRRRAADLEVRTPLSVGLVFWSSASQGIWEDEGRAKSVED